MRESKSSPHTANPEYLPIADACRHLSGKRPAPATVWRWIRRGVRGERLNALRIRGRWHCTEGQLRDFLERSTKATLSESVPDNSSSDESLRQNGLL